MQRRRTRSEALPQLQRRAAGGTHKRRRKAPELLDDDDTYNGEQLARKAVADRMEDSDGSETQMLAAYDTQRGAGAGEPSPNPSI